MNRFSLGIVAPLNCSFKRTHPTNMLFQFLLGMPIRFIDWLRRFTQVMEMAQLMRNIGQHRPNCLADGMLSI
jgi:hypothetical protein